MTVTVNIGSGKVASGDKAYRKAFGFLMPCAPDEEATWDADIAKLSKAAKFAKKSRAACELKFTNQKAFRQAARTYLTSGRCLQAAMLEANKKRNTRDRISPRQILECSGMFKIIQKLDEPVSIRIKPKSSGFGFRLVHDFGPVARGAHLLAAEIIRMAFTPAPFQYTSLGTTKAVAEAIRLIEEEGFGYMAELDIRSHFPSFSAENLVKTLPLPKGVVQHVVAAQTAKTQHTYNTSFKTTFITPPPGIPQGSAASPAVAEWSLSHLAFESTSDVVLINYADNLFLFAKNTADLEPALDALSFAVTKLPGGAFQAPIKQNGPVTQPFAMLGYELEMNAGMVTAEPGPKATKSLWDESERMLDEAHNALNHAANTGDTFSRFLGVQAVLRLEYYVQAWCDAYRLADNAVYQVDRAFFIERLKQKHKITAVEEKWADDPSLKLGFKFYSSW